MAVLKVLIAQVGNVGVEVKGKEEMEKLFWSKVEAGDVPICGVCKSAPLIPDVVFFGMSLPRRFHETRTADFRSCDPLIVAGTTLVVYPFAGLVGEVF